MDKNLVIDNIDGLKPKYPPGQDSSWEIVDDTTVRKKCDNLFYQYQGSWLPQKVCSFFGVYTTKIGEKQSFIVEYDGTEYNAQIRCSDEDSRDSQIFWNGFASQFKDFAHDGIQHALEFRKVSDGRYSAHLVEWEDVEKENGTMAEFDRNMILYGPPGTGKTYNSVIYAVAICEGKNIEAVQKEPYSNVLTRYKDLKDGGRIEFTTFHQSYGYEEFIEGIKPKMDSDSDNLSYAIEDGTFKSFCKRATSYISNEPFVFIIDEINRGNISKIFGELITLIEDTKRAGASEAMEAILPYSGESFSVPDNVYILGTMNTADRSIALMDTALRRRFEFIEMMPNPEVLESLGVGTIEVNGEELNVAKMLNVINERIEYLFDREHTIGHAFFTKLAEDPSIETLASIFEKNVIPLLQEYFYEDYEKIQLVLGDNDKEDEFKFVLDKPLKIKDIFNGNPDIDLPEKGYEIQRTAFYKLESYKQIGKGL